MLAYKAKNGPAPSYLKALVTPRTAPRSLRSTSTARLVPPSLRVPRDNPSSAWSSSSTPTLRRRRLKMRRTKKSTSERLENGSLRHSGSCLAPKEYLQLPAIEITPSSDEDVPWSNCSTPSASPRHLEKAYDRVPREDLWYCMRKSGVAEKYVRVVQDMYERSRTVVRCAVGQTEEFKVEVGLHQGSALSPFLFAMVMDQLSEEVRQESPWTMMFADDIVICNEIREQVEENLERWSSQPSSQQSSHDDDPSRFLTPFMRSIVE
ncbi:hypothetical protein QTP70_011385 [Hemibagrus guttatus]|uniref:ribonuclease H n=1 Tax=Hemibagrus guttatus TaxID=175788 RepID=A0AAE0RA76_9TELE|nr:hypothetical protein QTP70_011385 [Hemibagrus guttatus]